MSCEHRLQCLRDLKDIGYQTGTGIMVGSPGQTIEHLIQDILFIEQLRPEMIGIGPFLPHRDTPFAQSPAEPWNGRSFIIHLPSDASVGADSGNYGTGYPHSRRPGTGILAGANVVMPNLSPQEERKSTICIITKPPSERNLRKDSTYCNSSWKRSVIKSPSPEAITNNKEMYKVDSPQAEEFIHHEEILETLEYAWSHKDNRAFIEQLIEKAALCKGLTHREAATLLECDQPDLIERIFHLAKEIKQKFYGNRIVMFAPLYLSNYCVNGCVYCLIMPKQNNRPQETDAGRNTQGSNRFAGYGA